MTEARMGIVQDRLAHTNGEDIRIRIIESRTDSIYDLYIFLNGEHIAHVIDGDKESAVEALTTLFGEGMDEELPEEYLAMLGVEVEYVDVDKEDMP